MPRDKIDISKLKVHPAAKRFPLMEEDRLAALADDIEKNGLFEPIVVTADGTLLVDGRNRLKACKKVNVQPDVRRLASTMTDVEVIDFIVGKNMERRDLGSGQRAILAVQLKRDILAAEAKQRQGNRNDLTNIGSSSGQSEPKRVSKQIADQFHIGNGTVAQAISVIDNSEELTKEVLTGELSLNDAYKQVRRQLRQRPRRETSSTGRMITLLTHTGEEVQYELPKGNATFNETNEHISWAAWSWNPVTGCLHGCKYCYARDLATKPSFRRIYPVGFTPLFHHERLDAPNNMRVPEEASEDSRLKRVFVCSMADLYGKWVPDEWIQQVHAKCVENQQWDYLMLTKFPRRYVGMDLPPTAWLGTSVDEQKRVRLAEEAFRQISGVRVKWLSLEPLLAPLAFTDLSMFDWIVIGSQTQTDQPDGIVAEFAPPFEWVARLVAQAREAGCKVYLKPNLLGQVDPQHPGMDIPQEEPEL